MTGNGTGKTLLSKEINVRFLKKTISDIEEIAKIAGVTRGKLVRILTTDYLNILKLGRTLSDPRDQAIIERDIQDLIRRVEPE